MRLKVVNCCVCAAEFVSKPRRGPISQHCSRACRDRASYDRCRRKPAVCHRCGVNFQRRASADRYCSLNCRHLAAYERRREAAGDPYPVECALCGDIFIKDPLGNRGHQVKKYCSANCTRQAGRDQRRAKQVGREVERIDRHLVFERDEYVCGICHKPVDRNVKYPDAGFASLDHIIPIARGGCHTYDNVQCSHLACNLIKAAKIRPKPP